MGNAERASRASPRPIHEPHGLPWVKTRERRFRRGLAASDALLSALVLGIGLGLHRSPAFVAALVAVPVLVVLWAKLAGLYDRDDLKVHKTTLEEVPRLVSMATALMFAFVLFERAAAPAPTAAPALGLSWAALVAGLTLGRWGMRRLLERWCGLERCLVLGDRALADDVDARTSGHGGAVVVAHEPISVAIGRPGNLAARVAEDRIDRVILAPSESTPIPRLLEAIRSAKESGARVSVLPTTGILTGRTSERDDLSGEVLLGIERFRPTRSSRLVKRGFDLLAAGGVFLLTAPLLGILMLLVRLDSAGPALYRQVRVGRGGHRFTVYKLRTMVADAEARRDELLERSDAGDGMFKMHDDPRITRIGGFLRRTHMDELPQVLNVLRGDMSLVGPRPLIVEEDDLVSGSDRTRLDITPGMTGPWQVVGGHRRVPMQDMLKLDYAYVTEWSLWTDVLILLRTAKLVIGRGGV